MKIKKYSTIKSCFQCFIIIIFLFFIYYNTFISISNFNFFRKKKKSFVLRKANVLHYYYTSIYNIYMY